MYKKIIMYRFCRQIFIPLILLIIVSCQNTAEKEYTVMKGKFIQSVTETGELQAISAVSIIMPRISHRYGYSYKIVGILDHGSMVEKGDSVVALDPSSVYKYIIQTEEQLENARAKAEKQQVEANNRRRDLEVQLKNQESAWNLKKLELERIQFETEKKKKVKELEFRKASLQLEKIKRKLSLNPTIEKYDRRISELEIMQRKADIENARDVLKNLVLHSPGKGYFQISYNRRSNNQHYKPGDEVYIGTLVARIPDISEMKALSYFNETDINKMKEGMKVIIRLDALPDVSFEGAVREISRICTERDDQKVFTTDIKIIDHDARLKPGMSVSCEYIVYESEDELYVPNECLLSEGGKTYVFIKRFRKFKKTEVETGPSNANHTIIHTKLRPGRELLPAAEVATDI